MVKVEQEPLDIDIGESYDNLQPEPKIGHLGVAQQEFDYKSWERCTTNYPKVEITDEMMVKACTTLPAFC